LRSGIRSKPLSLSDLTPFGEGRDVLTLSLVKWTRTLQVEGLEYDKRLDRQ
jgi:hypothetical protein